MTKTHVILCLTRFAWGETAFGVHLAKDLHAQGQGVVFFVHPIAASLFQSLPFTYELASEDLGRLFKLFLETYVTKRDIASIVLADARGAGDFLGEIGCDPGFLLRYGIPIIAVDTWSSSESGKFMDWFANEQRPVPVDWLPSQTPALAPVPFVRPEGIRGACQFLPARPPSPPQDKKVRQQLGIPAGHRVVLLCTAYWQHANYIGYNVDGARMAKQVPRLLAHYFAQLGPRVHLIHVGPSSWESVQLLGERYHWVPPLAPHEFDSLLPSVDLLLTLNVTSTIIGKAIACNVPILLLYNSYCGESLEGISANCSFKPTPFVREWVEQSVPLYAFFVWPVGHWRFLSPVLVENPYMRTMETVEVLDETGFVEKCDGLLTDSDRRERLLHEQTRYVAQVSSLPRPAELVTRFLGT